MTNKNTTLILGAMFILASFFSSSDAYIICASVFFSANFIIDEMQNLARKENENRL